MNRVGLSAFHVRLNRLRAAGATPSKIVAPPHQTSRFVLSRVLLAFGAM
jgi:hypothetical protein